MNIRHNRFTHLSELLTKKLILSLAALLLLPLMAAAADPAPKPDRGPKNLGTVLVFSGTGWYRHPETPAINGWLARLSTDLGMQVDVSETPKDLVQILDRYQVLLMNNCNELTTLLDAAQRAKVEQWYRAGGGIVALHAALVHQKEWTWFYELAGCDFNSDSEFLEARVVINPAGKDHPAVRGQPGEFKIKADWTNHDRSVTGREGIQVLMRVDESTYEPVRDYFKTRGGVAMGKDHPISWINTLNDGRFFYTELGHDVRSLDTPFGRSHILGAIGWAARMEPVKRQAAAGSQPGVSAQDGVWKPIAAVLGGAQLPADALNAIRLKIPAGTTR